MAEDKTTQNEQTEEERRQANEEAGRTQDQQQEQAAQRTAEAPSVKEGDRVTILVDTPQGQPVKGTVRVVNEEGGHQVGVELDEYVAYGHSLEGLVDEREQGGDLPVIGKGWWTRPENVEVEK